MRFRDRYYFLSNMYPCNVAWYGYTYNSSETVYQMEKCLIQGDKEQFKLLNGFQAKRQGRSISIRPDWNEIKDDIMRRVLKSKFNNERLKAKLICTGHTELVEDNHWGDTYWGRCNGKGQNKLGIMLMELRKELSQ